jgi:hypothetical protein
MAWGRSKLTTAPPSSSDSMCTVGKWPTLARYRTRTSNAAPQKWFPNFAAIPDATHKISRRRGKTFGAGDRLELSPSIDACIRRQLLGCFRDHAEQTFAKMDC